jgi:hypothetical protein
MLAGKAHKLRTLRMTMISDTMKNFKVYMSYSTDVTIA